MCVPRAWRLAGRGTGEMLSSCGVVSRKWEWKCLLKMRYAGTYRLWTRVYWGVRLWTIVCWDMNYSILGYTDYGLWYIGIYRLSTIVYWVDYSILGYTDYRLGCIDYSYELGHYTALSHSLMLYILTCSKQTDSFHRRWGCQPSTLSRSLQALIGVHCVLTSWRSKCCELKIGMENLEWDYTSKTYSICIRTRCGWIYSTVLFQHSCKLMLSLMFDPNQFRFHCAGILLKYLGVLDLLRERYCASI